MSFVSIIASAQPMITKIKTRWGLEGGICLSHANETHDYRPAFHIGITGDVTFGEHWFVDGALRIGTLTCGDKYISNDPDYKWGVQYCYTPYYATLPIRLGYKKKFTPNIVASLSGGPLWGFGLFGRGTVREGEPGDMRAYHTNGIFNADDSDCFSSSRYEYGLSIRFALEHKQHYIYYVEYILNHIEGKLAIVKDVSQLSFNFGYKF